MTLAEEVRNGHNANHMLLETTENVFSDQAPLVDNLLRFKKELFAQEVLDRSLLSCCKNNTFLLMPAIILAGANLEATDEIGNTPLLVCALNSNELCARFLIRSGADVNAVNFVGNTPLIHSVWKSSAFGIAKLLVGNKDIKIDHVNKNGFTAFHYAIETANMNAIKLLIYSGANLERNKLSLELSLKNPFRNEILSLVKLFQLHMVTGKSPLLHAALSGDLESAESLVSMDESSVYTSNDSFASIMIQILECMQCMVVKQPEVEMFELLLKQVNVNYISSKNKTIIMDLAISIGDCSIIESLCQFDFIISHQNLSSAVYNPEFLRFLLTKRHIINKLDGQNQPVYDGSALYEALQNVKICSAKSLIQYGAFMDLDQALKNAVKSNQAKSLLFIMSEFPADVGQKLKSLKLLRDAVKKSALNVITILLDHGVDINAEYNGKYCLTQAADVTVLELLLFRGADPNLKIRRSSQNFTYPLHRLLSGEFRNIKKGMWRYLLNPGLSNILLNIEIKDCVKCLLRYGARADLTDCLGQTALHCATRFGHSVDVLKLLIDSGLDVNKTDDRDQTPLWGAVVNQDVAAVKFLIDAGADINLVCKFSGQSVIFEARNKTILDLLLDRGAGIKITDIDGNSPLHSLMIKDPPRAGHLKRLIDAGCDINYKNKDGDTVLIHAAKYVDITVIELLVQEGADVNASGKTFPYLTPVTSMLRNLWSKSERAVLCINYLMDHNADIDKVSSLVIHLFISSGCFSLIPKFISRGLAPAYLIMEKRSDLPHDMGFSPLMMALILNQSDLARYFINIRYLNMQDIDFFYTQTLEEVLATKSLSLLKTLGQQPLSLETLCFVVISDTLGPTQDRRSKVQKLEIPQKLKDSLLFKNVNATEIKDVDRGCYVYFKKSLKQLNLYQSDSENQYVFRREFLSEEDFY